MSVEGNNQVFAQKEKDTEAIEVSLNGVNSISLVIERKQKATTTIRWAKGKEWHWS